MPSLTQIVNDLSDFVWGPYLLIPLLLGAGVYLMIGLRFMPLRCLGHAFAHMWRGRKHGEGAEGELTPFNALMTSLAATVGTGNIVGVATAIFMGGPGAVFWMWMTAVFGMATKYCEATLAVKYRDVTPNGSYVGGPMYYIRKGLGENWSWLATLFAVFGAVACFGIGNLTQANSIAANLISAFKIPDIQLTAGAALPASWMVAFALFIVTGAVILGGVKRIGAVAGTLVPLMAFFYICVGVVILCKNASRVPDAFGLIFSHAFAPASAVGGFAGAVIKESIQRGVSRGLFSNEAGLGSAPIAHATATTKNPVHQGFLGMLDPFIDTLVVCTITAMVILVSGEWTSVAPPEVVAKGEEAVRRFLQATLTARSFNTALPGFGEYAVAVGLLLFAFSTILGWCVYGERCIIYLFGHKASLPFRIFFVLIVPVGAVAKLDLVWALSDLFNGLMAIPNLVALLLLSPVVFSITRNYFEEREAAQKRGTPRAF